MKRTNDSQDADRNIELNIKKYIFFGINSKGEKSEPQTKKKTLSMDGNALLLISVVDVVFANVDHKHNKKCVSCTHHSA